MMNFLFMQRQWDISSTLCMQTDDPDLVYDAVDKNADFYLRRMCTFVWYVFYKKWPLILILKNALMSLRAQGRNEILTCAIWISYLPMSQRACRRALALSLDAYFACVTRRSSVNLLTDAVMVKWINEYTRTM